MIYERPDLKIEKFTISDAFAAAVVLSGPESNVPGFIDENNDGPDNPDKPVTEEIFENVFNIF